MITIYTIANCPKCKMLKAKMDKKGIKYEECSDTDLMICLGLFELPVLKIDETFIHGIKEQNNWVESQDSLED